MSKELPQYFHLHLISDATGETLKAIAKAVAVQYTEIREIEHVHALTRTKPQLDRVIQEIEAAPGMVLYTLLNEDLRSFLEERCRQLGVPCVSILDPILDVFESYLGKPTTLRVGGQHVLDTDYFRRIDALNFTLIHDDGHLPDDLSEAEIILLGISRTSKTPTSIYLANRGFKTANVPLVPGIPIPPNLETAEGPLVVGLVASPEHIVEVRQNRVMAFPERHLDDYVDRSAISEEIAYTRRLCAKKGWPVIDVTRRSIEEVAAAILKHLHDQPAL